MLQFFVTIVLVSKKITVLFKKATLQKNFVIVKAKLDGIDTDDIGHLEDSPRFVFIDEERKNLIVVNDGRELIQNINKKKKFGCDKCCRREYFFSNHVEYCESVR